MLVVLSGFASHAQTSSNTTTTSQDALATFESGWITLDYNALTTTQKQNLILTWVGLKVAVIKELDSNRIIAEALTAEEQAAQLALIAARRQQMITYLTNYGFRCDNSQYDWYKLYNRPSVFGSNWQMQADYQMSLSTGLDYFLNVAYTLWKEFVKN
jgi:hypothetical protein